MGSSVAGLDRQGPGGRPRPLPAEAGVAGYQRFTVSDGRALRRALLPGDVVLIEGDRRFSRLIKYVTQSTWSHATIYVGDALATGSPERDLEPHQLIEADLERSVIATPLSAYDGFNLRFCRAAGLDDADRERVVGFCLAQLGGGYDLKNVVDLLRYLLPVWPLPLPGRWRRRALALGSGDPTRTICSTLIARAFQSVRYPILPHVRGQRLRGTGQAATSEREILHIRHHSLFTPSDFDLSPYFRIVKPTIEAGFDHRTLRWYGEDDV